MKAAAKDLEPGSSVFDHDHPERARMVHSVVPGEDGLMLVRFGHPDGEPEEDKQKIGTVPADKEYEVIADASGQRL